MKCHTLMKIKVECVSEFHDIQGHDEELEQQEEDKRRRSRR